MARLTVARGQPVKHGQTGTSLQYLAFVPSTAVCQQACSMRGSFYLLNRLYDRISYELSNVAKFQPGVLVRINTKI